MTLVSIISAIKSNDPQVVAKMWSEKQQEYTHKGKFLLHLLCEFGSPQFITNLLPKLPKTITADNLNRFPTYYLAHRTDLTAKEKGQVVAHLLFHQNGGRFVQTNATYYSHLQKGEQRESAVETLRVLFAELPPAPKKGHLKEMVRRTVEDATAVGINPVENAPELAPYLETIKNLIEKFTPGPHNHMKRKARFDQVIRYVSIERAKQQIKEGIEQHALRRDTTACPNERQR